MRYDKVWRDQYGNDITTIGNRNPMPWALEGEELLEYLFLICGGAFGAFSPSPWGSYLAKADEESDSLFERIGPEGFKTENLNTAALNNLYDYHLVPWARETGYFYFHKKDKFDTTHKVMIDVFVEALIDAKALKTNAQWIQYFGIDKTNITEFGSNRFDLFVKENLFEKYDEKLYQRIKDDKTILNPIDEEIRYLSNQKNGWIPERTLIKLVETESEMEEFENGSDEDYVAGTSIYSGRGDCISEEFIEI